MTLFEEEDFLYIKLIMLVDFLWRYTDWDVDFPTFYDIRLYLWLLMKQKTWTTYIFILRMHGEILYLIWCAKYDSHNTMNSKQF